MNKTDYDGIITKPSMEEVLYHGAFHKYLNKYMGKNGKWVYVYNQAKGMANKAAGAANGAVSKAKTALPGLQKKAMSTAVSTRNKVGSAVSSGSKQASALKKKAQNRISTMLPILSKKLKKAVTKKTKALKGAYYSGKSKGAEVAAKHKREKKMKIGSYSITTNGNRIGVNDDVRIFGAHNISSQSGRVGSRVNEGISAGRKRVAKKRKNKK